MEYNFVKFYNPRRRNSQEVSQLKVLAQELGLSYNTIRHPSYKKLLTQRLPKEK